MNALKINPQLTTEILIRFIREETLSSGFHKVLLGVSGGLDSAVACALAVRALGLKNVLGVMMPYKASSPDSERLAKTLAKKLKIKTEKIVLTEMADSYLRQAKKIDRLRTGNVLARCRMIVLYDLSAREKALVLGTSNKTELLLGYGTVFGDMASALNPLGDLYKTQVYQLAEYLKVPKEIISRKPTPDLWEGQTSEQELGFTYAKVDRLLYYLIDRRYTEAELAEKGFDLKFVRKIAARIRTSQYKRRLPIIAKVSHRTINKDFRYLRDWGS